MNFPHKCTYECVNAPDWPEGHPYDIVSDQLDEMEATGDTDGADGFNLLIALAHQGLQCKRFHGK